MRWITRNDGIKPVFVLLLSQSHFSTVTSSFTSSFVALLFLIISFSPNETSVEYTPGIFHARVPVIFSSLMSGAPERKAIQDEPRR